MKKNVIVVMMIFTNFYLFSQEIISNSIKKYKDAQIFTYSTEENKEKSNDIKFIINIPNDYTSKDGIRPHILKQFTFTQNNSGTYIICNIQINILPDETNYFTEEEIANFYFSQKSIKKAYEKYKILFSERTKYEGQPGHFIITLGKIERAGFTINMLNCIQRFIYKKCLVSINCIYSCEETILSLTELENQFNSFKLLNMLLGNSIVISKY